MGERARAHADQLGREEAVQVADEGHIVEQGGRAHQLDDRADHCAQGEGGQGRGDYLSLLPLLMGV